MGAFVVEALLKTGKHRVTAISRADSKSTMPSGVEVKRVDYDQQESLVDALKGHDALIITMGAMAPPTEQRKLVEAAAAAKIPWVLPNEYSSDLTNEGLQKDTFLGQAKQEVRHYIEQLGVSDWIAIACNFWYEFSLAGGPIRYGFDFDNRTVTFFDDGKTRINTTTWPQTGLSVARLLSLKVLPEDEQDKSTCLSHFRNKPMYVSSFCINQREMFDSVLGVTGTKEDDWKVESQDVVQRYQEGCEAFKTGDMRGFGQLLYSRVFYPDGSGNYEMRHGLHNDVLGLPKEDLDEATKIAAQMAADKRVPY